MLRLLTLLLILAMPAALYAQADPGATPNAAASADAATAARSAVDQATALLRQRHFVEQMQHERQAMEEVAKAPPPNTSLDLGATPPSPEALVKLANSPTRQWSETNRQPPLLLVSFSMPDADLRELARQAGRIGAPLVLRGLVDDSFPATQKKLAAFGDIPGAAFMVDPTLFRRFQVESVPTFILPLERLTTCTNDRCPMPASIRVSGEAGLDHILDEIERRGHDPRVPPLVAQLRAMLEAAQ